MYTTLLNFDYSSKYSQRKRTKNYLNLLCHDMLESYFFIEDLLTS